MSTRCNVLVKYHNEKRMHQYYHHSDGYPEYMGEMLKAFITSTYFIGNDNIFKQLLLSEERFEDEGFDEFLHGDIEYIWYVDLVKFKLTYTHIVNPFELDDSEFDKLRMATIGEEEIEL